MRIAVLIILLIFSHRVFAGNECEIRLYSVDNLDVLLTQKVIYADEKEMTSSFIKLYDENSTDQIMIKVFHVGWPGEELAALEVFRDKNNKTLESISGTSQIKGEGHKVFWFDIYKIDYDCSLI